MSFNQRIRGLNPLAQYLIIESEYGRSSTIIFGYILYLYFIYNFFIYNIPLFHLITCFLNSLKLPSCFNTSISKSRNPTLDPAFNRKLPEHSRDITEWKVSDQKFHDMLLTYKDDKEDAIF